MQLEWRLSNFNYLEKLFGEALRPYGDVPMWRLYVQYVRLGNELTEPSQRSNTVGGNATSATSPIDVTAMASRRQTIIKAYELALASVGVDLYSSSLYIDYIAFLLTTTVLFISNFIPIHVFNHCHL